MTLKIFCIKWRNLTTSPSKYLLKRFPKVSQHIFFCFLFFDSSSYTFCYENISFMPVAPCFVAEHHLIVLFHISSWWLSRRRKNGFKLRETVSWVYKALISFCVPLQVTLSTWRSRMKSAAGHADALLPDTSSRCCYHTVLNLETGFAFANLN